MSENEAVHVKRMLIEGDGFAQLKGLITPEHAQRVRKRLLARLDSAASLQDGVLRVPDLFGLGDEVASLVTHPRLLAAAHELLGKDATLASYSGRVLMPGCDIGALHVDWPYWAMNPGMPADPPLMLQVIWMMEPFGSTNGGTLVAPASQRWQGPLDLERFNAHAVQVEGEAGDAILSHGLLWHRTAINRASEPRVAVLINYTQLTVRPMAPLGPFTDDFMERASPELRALLAVDYHAAVRRRAPRLR